jgi:hypothetical protein
MDLKETEFVSVDYIHLAQDRVQWLTIAEEGNEPSCSLKHFLASGVTNGFSRQTLFL